MGQPDGMGSPMRGPHPGTAGMPPRPNFTLNGHGTPPPHGTPPSGNVRGPSPMMGPPRPGNYGGMSRMPPPPSSTQNTPFMNGPSSLPPNSSGQFNNSFSSPVGGPPKSNIGPPPMVGGQGQNINSGVQKPSGTPAHGWSPLGRIGIWRAVETDEWTTADESWVSNPGWRGTK